MPNNTPDHWEINIPDWQMPEDWPELEELKDWPNLDDLTTWTEPEDWPPPATWSAGLFPLRQNCGNRNAPK